MAGALLGSRQRTDEVDGQLRDLGDGAEVPMRGQWHERGSRYDFGGVAAVSDRYERVRFTVEHARRCDDGSGIERPRPALHRDVLRETGETLAKRFTHGGEDGGRH